MNAFDPSFPEALTTKNRLTTLSETASFEARHVSLSTPNAIITLMKYLLLLTIAAILSSCATATLTNFETGEVLKGKFTDGMGTGGKCKVTMTNGELLEGRYSALRGHESITFGSSNSTFNATGSAYSTSGNSVYGSAQGTGSTFGSAYTTGGQGVAHAMLKSTTPGSKLMMEIYARYNVVSGGGMGEARTNDGRYYKVDF
jgi:hypothetical protein